MKDIALTHLLDTALCAAEAAGNHALAHQDRRMETLQTYTHDIKLVLDLECQQMAETLIASEFPEHSILGEEHTRRGSSEGYEWIIDPIDGTVNYAHGFPYWCVSVAVRHHEKILAGCVFNPESNQFYTAHIEEEAKCNGSPIHVSKTNRLDQAMVFTGISKYMELNPAQHFGTFETLATHTHKLRINGSAALDLCHVADGAGDGYFESNIYLWDHAAAGLIAEQAGATLLLYPHTTDPHGVSVLCANPALIDELGTMYNHTR